MQLIKAKYKIRCEMGACKNLAARTIRMERTGVRAGIHICDDCLGELYRAIGGELIPKSIETAAPRAARRAKRAAKTGETAAKTGETEARHDRT